MEDLLGRYRDGGKIESSGAFTLDPKKAIEKLAEFQLPSSYHWILKLIQSLHLSGAKSIDIAAGITGVQVVADASPQGFDTMEDLLAHLLMDPAHSSPTLRHLAAGLQGCLAVRPRDIQATLWENGASRSYLLKSGGWREGETKNEAKPTNRFELTLARNRAETINSSWFAFNTDIFDLFLRRPGAYDRENSVVFEACPFAHCEIRLKGKVVSQRAFGHPRFPGYDIRADIDPGRRTIPVLKALTSSSDYIANAADRRHHLVERVVPADVGEVGFRLPQTSHATVTNRDDDEIRSLVQERGLQRAYAIRMELSPLALIVFIEDGVIIETRTLPLGCPGLVALIDAKPLRKDLSTLGIVDGDNVSQLFGEVRAVGSELKNQIKENMERMPGRDILLDQLFREPN